MAEPRTPNTFEQAYPGRFLRAGSFDGKAVTLTIVNVVNDELEGEKGKELKLIVAFKETALALVCAKINGACLKAMFGGHVPAWIGKRVTFYPTDQIMPFPAAKGDDRFCIRVLGSPDIAAPVTFDFKVPRRKGLTLTLKPTGKPAEPTA